MTLSNAQRLERRKQIAEMVQKTQNTELVSEYFGVSRRTVQWACMEFKVEFPFKRTGHPKKTKPPKSPKYHKYHERHLAIAEDLKQGHSVSDCSAKYGVTPQTIYNVRRIYGLDPKPDPIINTPAPISKDVKPTTLPIEPNRDPVITQLAIRKLVDASVRAAYELPAEEWSGVALWGNGDLELVWGIGDEHTGEQGETEGSTILFKSWGWVDERGLDVALSEKIQAALSGDSFWLDMIVSVSVSGCRLRASGITFSVHRTE